MCFSGGNKSPSAPPPVIAPPPVPNKVANKQDSDAARDLQKKQALLATGQKDTILTSSVGDTTQANIKKQTLG